MLYADPIAAEGSLRLHEHVCLESGELLDVARPLHACPGPRYTFVSPGRGCETEFAFSADHRLTVRLRSPKQVPRKHFLDLRFVDPATVAVRRIAWRLWQASAGLGAIGVLVHALVPALAGPAWQAFALPATIGLATAAVCVALVAICRTREIVELRSLHGGARLVGITGGLGSARDTAQFAAELSRRVEAARGQTMQTKQQFLRDEMREHHRLWQEGVLSDRVYESSKRRILRAHD